MAVLITAELATLAAVGVEGRGSLRGLGPAAGSITPCLSQGQSPASLAATFPPPQQLHPREGETRPARSSEATLSSGELAFVKCAETGSLGTFPAL